jgi:hypothetical protein
MSFIGLMVDSPQRDRAGCGTCRLRQAPCRVASSGSAEEAAVAFAARQNPSHRLADVHAS